MNDVLYKRLTFIQHLILISNMSIHSCKNGIYRPHVGTFQHLRVADLVLPLYVQDTSQTPLVKAAKLFLMPRICGPGFTTVEESTEHTGLINVYPGFLSEAGVSIPSTKFTILYDIASEIAFSIPELFFVQSDWYMVCCVFHDVDNCEPQSHLVSSCKRLLSLITIKTILTIQAAVATLVNGAIIIRFLTMKQSSPDCTAQKSQ